MRTPVSTVYRLSVKYPVLNSCCARCGQSRLKHSKTAWPEGQTKEPLPNVWTRSKFVQHVPEYDWDYITDPGNTKEIEENVHKRKGVGDIHQVLQLYKSYKDLKSVSQSDVDFYEENLEISLPQDYIPTSQEDDVTRIERELYKVVADLPNRTHPQVPVGDESCCRVISTVGTKREFDFPVRSAVKVGSILDALKTNLLLVHRTVKNSVGLSHVMPLFMTGDFLTFSDIMRLTVVHINLGVTTGHKTYFFKGAFARLQNALVRYAVDTLVSKGFELVTVPELVHPDIIEGCGFSVHGERTQVYHLDTGGLADVCLAGTGEMPLAAMFAQRTVTEEELPKRLCTISRCYRAETSSTEEEKGIYRVHQFTKVEMFGVTSAGSCTQDLVDEFLKIQKDLFSRLGLHFRILEMSSQELGSSAYRKYDMEAWMAHKRFWGEISSTSDCSDYQSRRLGMKYWRGDVQEHLHTVNGTACAVPRLIMAIAENCQTKHGHIEIPLVLQPYLGGDTVLSPPTQTFKTVFLSPSREYKKHIEES